MEISNPVKWRLWVLVAIVLMSAALLACLFRYSVVPLAPVMAIKLDRWTGKTYFGHGDAWTPMSDPSNAEQVPIPIVKDAQTGAFDDLVPRPVAPEIACNWDGTPCDEKRR